MELVAEKFKQTEVGLLPIDWKVHRLKKVVSLINGRAYKQEELLLSGKYQVLRVGNFFSNNSWYYSDLELEDNKYVKYGDLMYAWSASFGPRFWYEEKTIYHYHIWKVITSNKIDKLFLFHLFEFDKAKILNQSQGGTMFHITKGDMESRFLQLPPIAEQTAIATALSDADALISSLEKLIAKKLNIKQGAMQKLLEPAAGWEVKKLGEIIQSLQLGGNYPNSEIPTSYPLIKMGNIQRGFIAAEKLEYIPEEYLPNKNDLLHFGDILFNTRNTLDLVGKVAIWRNELQEAYFNSNLLRLKFKPLYIASNFFICYVLNAKYSISRLRDIATGTTSVAAIYTKDLLKIEIPFPPKEQQTLIASILSDMDAEINSLETKLEKYKKVKLGMMQNLLTGKIRLI